MLGDVFLPVHLRCRAQIFTVLPCQASEGEVSHGIQGAHQGSVKVDGMPWLKPASQSSVIYAALPLQSFVYVAALQLLLSAPKKSLVAGLCGLLAGVLYRTNFMGIGDLKVCLAGGEARLCGRQLAARWLPSNLAQLTFSVPAERFASL